MFGKKKRLEKERIAKYIASETKLKEKSKASEKKWISENFPKFKKKDVFGDWIIMEDGVFASSMIFGCVTSYNYRYLYHSINKNTGEEKWFEENKIALIKELTS